MNRAERGQHVSELVNDPIFADALAVTEEWAMQSFRRASTQEEAWNARLRVQANSEFTAFLMAAIQLGKSEVAELMAKRAKMSAKRRDKQAIEDYLGNAVEARRKFDEKHPELAETG